MPIAGCSQPGPQSKMPSPDAKPRARVALLHTVPTLTAEMDRLLEELVPDVSAIHLFGEGFLDMAAKTGSNTPELTERVIELVQMGADAGACAVLVTCSTIGPCAEAARKAVPVPVFRIDEPMAEQAVDLGTRIVVLATTPTTLASSEDLIRRKATAVGRDIDLDVRLCEFPSPPPARDPVQARDAVLLTAIRDAAETADVIVLAQASMAGTLERNPVDVGCPVLTSPRSGMLQIKNCLDPEDPTAPTPIDS